MAAEEAATADVLLEPAPEPPPADPGPERGPQAVTLTFYNCSGQGGGYCGAMASGATVYEGAAACGYSWALGTRFVIAGDPTGRTYTCEDRGYLDWFHVDVFWWDYASGRAWRNQLPLYADVEVIG